MRIQVLLLTCSLLLAAADPRETEIRTAEAEFDKCWNARDPDCMAKILTDDFIQITRTANVYNKQGFLTGLKAGNYSIRNSRQSGTPPETSVIRFYGPTAIVTGSRLGPWGRPKQTPNQVLHQATQVWVNTDGKGWKLATLHVSLPPAPSEPAK